MAIVERPDSDREGRPLGDQVPTILRSEFEEHIADPAVHARYVRVAQQRAGREGLHFREVNGRPASSEEPGSAE